MGTRRRQLGDGRAEERRAPAGRWRVPTRARVWVYSCTLLCKFKYEYIQFRSFLLVVSAAEWHTGAFEGLRYLRFTGKVWET